MSDCKCNMKTKLVGDGCEKCNPELAIEIYKETIEEQSEEIERLTKERDELIRNVADANTVIADMKRERDELAASHARLRETFRKALGFIDDGYNAKNYFKRILEETPAQSLAHIEARALRREADAYKGAAAIYERRKLNGPVSIFNELKDIFISEAEALEAEAKEIEDDSK